MNDYEQRIGQVRFGAALTLARAFKFLACLTVLGGFLMAIAGAVELDDALDGDSVVTYVGAVAVTTAVAASILAFFGCVLEILVEVWEHAWHIRFDGADGDDS